MNAKTISEKYHAECPQFNGIWTVVRSRDEKVLGTYSVWDSLYEFVTADRQFSRTLRDLIEGCEWLDSLFKENE